MKRKVGKLESVGLASDRPMQRCSILKGTVTGARSNKGLQKVSECSDKKTGDKRTKECVILYNGRSPTRPMLGPTSPSLRMCTTVCVDNSGRSESCQ